MIFQAPLLLQTGFKLFGLAHCLAILTTILMALGLTMYVRRRREECSFKSLRYTMAAILTMAVLLDPVMTLIRYGTGPGGWALVVDSALPLYLCDVVSFILAAALIWKHQRLAEIGYLWGLAGTIQGLITPTLQFGEATMEFYVFFLQHGGVPVAAVLLVWGFGIVPEKGALKRAIFWSWGYMVIVMALNWMIGKNYGFLSAPPKVSTPFDYLGPYPYYLITLQVIAFSLYAILLKIAPKETTSSLH